MKRDRKLLICMNDDEYAALDRLVATYSEDGYRATKSFLVRHALKQLPYRENFGFLPLASKVRASNTAL